MVNFLQVPRYATWLYGIFARATNQYLVMFDILKQVLWGLGGDSDSGLSLHKLRWRMRWRNIVPRGSGRRPITADTRLSVCNNVYNL
jgi:hypothetical protein